MAARARVRVFHVCAVRAAARQRLGGGAATAYSGVDDARAGVARTRRLRLSLGAGLQARRGFADTWRLRHGKASAMRRGGAKPRQGRAMAEGLGKNRGGQGEV